MIEYKILKSCINLYYFNYIKYFNEIIGKILNLYLSFEYLVDLISTNFSLLTS